MLILISYYISPLHLKRARLHVDLGTKWFLNKSATLNVERSWLMVMILDKSWLMVKTLDKFACSNFTIKRLLHMRCKMTYWTRCCCMHAHCIWGIECNIYCYCRLCCCIKDPCYGIKTCTCGLYTCRWVESPCIDNKSCVSQHICNETCFVCDVKWEVKGEVPYCCCCLYWIGWGFWAC